MLCCGMDPTLAAWLAESQDGAEDQPAVLPLLMMIAASLALVLAATYGHA